MIKVLFTIQLFPFPPHLNMKILSTSQSCTFRNKRGKFYNFFSSSISLPQNLWINLIFYLPKGIEIIHLFKRRVHASQTRDVFFNRPPDGEKHGSVISMHWAWIIWISHVRSLPAVPLKHRRKHLEEVFFAFCFGRNHVVKRGIHAVKRSPLHGIRQHLHRCITREQINNISYAQTPLIHFW